MSLTPCHLKRIVLQLLFKNGQPVQTVDLANALQKTDLNNVVGIELIGHHIKIHGNLIQHPPALYLVTDCFALSETLMINGPKANAIPLIMRPVWEDTVLGVITSAVENSDKLYESYQQKNPPIPGLGKRSIPGTFHAALAVDTNSSYPFSTPANAYNMAFPTCNVIDVAGDSIVTLLITVDGSSLAYPRSVFSGRTDVSRGFAGDI